MDFDKIFIKDASPTKMGGQAVMEGIMMRGADRIAIAVRLPDGRINIKEEPLKKQGKWMKYPIIRGVVTFIDSLITGTRTLMYSAEVLGNAIEDDEENYEPGKIEKWVEEKFGEKGLFNFMLYGSVIFALLVSIGIFVLLPTWVVDLCTLFTKNAIILNLIEGILRILMFIVYIVLISNMKDIRRVFEYHGAEHQTIHCFENKLNLEPENCASFETLHPRCGTSFLMFVMIISLILFSFLGWPNVVMRIVSRILLIPVVAGLSYELLRWAGSSNSLFVRMLSIPGLLMQKLTTRVPDESQLQVAIAAVNACLSDEPPETRIYYVDSEGNRLPENKEISEANGENVDNSIDNTGDAAELSASVGTVENIAEIEVTSEESFENTEESQINDSRCEGDSSIKVYGKLISKSDKSQESSE